MTIFTVKPFFFFALLTAAEGARGFGRCLFAFPWPELLLLSLRNSYINLWSPSSPPDARATCLLFCRLSGMKQRVSTGGEAPCPPRDCARTHTDTGTMPLNPRMRVRLIGPSGHKSDYHCATLLGNWREERMTFGFKDAAKEPLETQTT
ncbi:uncharacterized protein Tco025E_09408 [Trypanosoma conorhini]|uniref:Secreted protein n=1 Tax=Trypanosoma conorhini TaxID=83891 RepID=A0A3R7JZ62_9TRYP|nr:uncharacterized protein Tco025E_09408 [Trypanosoma conorhini]RNE97795.1 hypothetical protein Tco025E_09408 [Trypanosoma conorhini]